MSSGGHIWPVRVYWEDTDAGGIVYHANYLKFTERARTELVRARGVDQQKMAAETGVFLVIRRAELEFLAPARLGDDLEVRTELVELRGATARLKQTITQAVGDRRIFVQGCTLAAVDRSGKPIRFPPVLRDVFEAAGREEARAAGS